jgi:neutral ceramidase
MRAFIAFFVVSIFSFVHHLSAAEPTSGSLKVGASMEVMNPPDAALFRENGERRFSGVHDDLYVRSIVIDNGVTKAALVSIDLSKVPGGDKFSERVAKAVGIQPEHLYITATHDHNTVRPPDGDTSTEYYHIIEKATIKSLKDAEKKLQPARVGYAKGKAYINTNRDEKIGEGYHMGYVPDGPSDKTVAVVSFTTPAGKPIAIYANYAVHAVVMYLATTKDGLPEITGDLPGFTSRYIEEHFEGAVALWTSGAAGDQNPLFMATYNQDHPDVVDQGIGGYAILDVQSRRLGQEIVRLTKSIKNTSSTVEIWGKKSSLTTPGRQRKHPRDPNVPRGGYMAPAQIEMIDGDPVTIPLHLLMLNDIALAGVSAEVFTEIGMRLKEQSPFDRTIMVTVMPDARVYVPTDAGFRLPSEKAISNSLKPGYVEPAMLKAFADLMDEYLSLKN